jgi:hypothetical protein
LYQLCPCKYKYVCDNGICKKPKGEYCVISSECAGESICHENTCVPKPSEWEIPIDNKCKFGLTIVDGHITLLDSKDTFVLLPGWIGFEGSISLCPSNHPDKTESEVLVLTKDEIFRVDTEKYIDNVIPVSECKRPFSRLSVNDTLFNYDKNIYLLRGSKIYKLCWVKSDKIKWDHVKTQELDNILLDDGTTLMRNGKKYLVDNTVLKTMIRNSVANKSLVSHNHLDIGINITTNIIQIIKDPNSDHIIFLNKDGTIKRHDCNNNITKPIFGRGKKLLVCNGEIWLITDNRCVKE